MNFNKLPRITKKSKRSTRKSSSRANHNLIVLGVGALAIATSLSLLVYHASGDIYLDRSRPGFLPDEQEAHEEDAIEQDYHFGDNGPLGSNDLDEYLTELQETIDVIDKLDNPYDESPLSDASLGIPATEDPDFDTES